VSGLSRIEVNRSRLAVNGSGFFANRDEIAANAASS
jgi:hypothetical protein